MLFSKGSEVKRVKGQKGQRSKGPKVKRVKGQKGQSLQGSKVKRKFVHRTHWIGVPKVRTDDRVDESEAHLDGKPRLDAWQQEKISNCRS